MQRWSLPWRMLRLLSGCVLTLAGSLLVAFGQPTARQMPHLTTETAVAADTFVNSICVVTHWSYPDTPYGANFTAVRALLAASGIRHVRDGQRAADLAAIGVHSIYVADVPNNANGNASTVATLVATIRGIIQQGGAIDAVEEPNDPHLFWTNFHKTHNGQGFPAGTIAFITDLYHALKSDPVTAPLPVIGPSLGTTLSYKGNPLGGTGALANVVDWGNMHPYPGGGNPFDYPEPYDTIAKYFWQSDQPSDNIDEHPFALDNYAPPFHPKPMAVTETGYTTNTGAISQAVFGKYMPRLFLEYFLHGIIRTCSYEFVDEWNDPNNREANFGLIYNNLTSKPAYNAIKNMIGLLSDPGGNFTPGSLIYGLTVTPVGSYTRTQYVHHLLLQQRNGTFYLALWHEVSGEDISTSPPRQIAVPQMPTTLTFSQPISHVTIYAPNDGAEATGSYSPNGAATYSNVTHLTLNVPDQVLLIKLAASAPAPTPAPSPTSSATPGATPTASIASISSGNAGTGIGGTTATTVVNPNASPLLGISFVLSAIIVLGCGIAYVLWHRRQHEPGWNEAARARDSEADWD